MGGRIILTGYAVCIIFVSLFLPCKNSEVCAEYAEKDTNDPYHESPADSDCIRTPKRQSYNYKLDRKELKTLQPPPDDDDEKYHDSTIISRRLSRMSDEETTTAFWNEKAQASLKSALNKENLNRNVAKNTVIYLGDGMGVQSVTAGRIMKGQLKGHSGEETELAMDSLPHFGFSKTYNVDYQVPDSAATATAYLCGVKTRYYTVGVNAATVRDNCASSKGNELQSVLKDAKRAGKSTGIVTTTYVNHATPAGAFASSASRTWYSDADLPEEAKLNDCKDIAHQLYDNLPYIDVVLGGGRRYFRPNTVEDEDYPGEYYKRKDGQDFIKQWQITTEKKQERAVYVRNKDQFDKVDPEQIDHLWGMFAPGSMDYEADRDNTMQPSLAEMTRKAIEILQKNPNGFYLLVEGARIDHSHHGGNAYRSLRDVVAFDDAIEVGLSLTSADDTLSVVTADHSHTFNMGEYSVRGNPITGLAPSNESPGIALDLKQYTALSYGNGPGYQGSSPDYENIVRENVTVEMTENIYYDQQTAVPLDSESHGGEDVAIFAGGPMAHLFHGVHEQNYIAHVMGYASCVGENKDHCLNREDDGINFVTEPPVEDNIVEFIGYNMSKAESEAALYSMFALELVFSIAIIGLCGVLVRKKRL